MRRHPAGVLGRPVAGAILGAALGALLLQGALAIELNGPIAVLTLAAVLGFVLVSGKHGVGAPEGARAAFGYANAITLSRGVLTALLAGLIGWPLTGTAGWLAAGLAAGCAFLDFLDGWAARRWKTVSAFGARFDMESDALFLLVACAVLVAADKAPGWVLAIGLMRYGFLAAGLVLPALRAPLPERRRRKAICALQAVALTLALAPVVSPAAVILLLSLSLAVLTVSFAIDIRWLLTRAGENGGTIAPDGASPTPTREHRFGHWKGSPR